MLQPRHRRAGHTRNFLTNHRRTSRGTTASQPFDDFRTGRHVHPDDPSTFVPTAPFSDPSTVTVQSPGRAAGS